MKLKILLMVFVISLLLPAAIQAEDNLEIFNRAKLLLFDKEWKLALADLEKFIISSGKSNYLPIAIFYKAKCLEEMKLRERAINTFQKYIKISSNKSLKEEANIAIIHLSFELYKLGGPKKHLKTVLDYLTGSSRILRYFAAFELSYATDKSIAGKAVPVLKKMVKNETDQDLVERGKVALLKINPKFLKQTTTEPTLQNAVIRIRITNKKTGKQVFAFNFPFALAALVLDAIPEEERSEMEEEGYDLDKIIDILVKTRQIIKIEGEESLFEIWIE